MGYSAKFRERIFNKTNGRCHLCRRTLSFNKYGDVRGRGAWEVEHSVPRARGGTDHLNNLYAACVPCNRRKGTATTRVARAKYGFRRAPFSREQKATNALKWGVLGSFSAFFAPPPLQLAAALVGAVCGAIVGHTMEPD